jgi:hypothetical protein
MILTKIKNRLQYYLIQKNIIEYLKIDGFLTKSEALSKEICKSV